MNSRRFGRTDWRIGEVGFGMWAMGGQWSESDDEESLRTLRRAVELGVNFFDTAWAYGEGRSERILGRLLREPREEKLYVATKVPPKNFVWPGRPQDPAGDVFPEDHIRRYAEVSLANLGVGRIDLLQLHVWDDSWAEDPGWQSAVRGLKAEGLIEAFGISVNRWEPANVLRALRTGLVDAVQVIYNIFDQAPEDELFPVCRELDLAVIARVPFDEGTLTGTLTRETRFAASDWRSRYFTPENLIPSVERAEKLKRLLPPGMTLPELALRFILAEPTVSVTIPGMRKVANLEANAATGDGRGLPEELRAALRPHRWDRQPAPWSA